MSSTKSSNVKGPKGPKPSEARVIQKEKRVPMKVVVGEPPNIEFQPPPAHLKGAMTVVVSNGKISRSFTIHHPIGVTDLGGGDWVISAAEDVPDLVARRTDGEADRVANLRMQYKLKLAVGAKLAELNADGILSYPGTGQSRDTVVADARARAKATVDQAHSAWVKAGSKGDAPKAPPYLEFVPDGYRKYEEALAGFLRNPSTLEEAERRFPNNFRTRSGPRMDRDQVSACPEGFEPPTADAAFDGLILQISQMPVLCFADAKLRTQQEVPKPDGFVPRVPPRPDAKGKGRGGGTAPPPEGEESARSVAEE